MDKLARVAKAPLQILVERAILPAPVSARLLADADAIASRMARRIVSETPGLGVAPLNRHFLRDLVAACRDALRVLVRRLHDGRGPRAGEMDRLALMGTHQADSAMPLDVLLAAYRIAAKVVWEEVVGTVARDEQMPAEALVAVASQIFDYLDQISGAVGAAYLERRERLLRQQDRDRDRILHRLIAGDDTADVGRAAVGAGLELEPPYRLVAVQPSVSDIDPIVERVWRPARILSVGDSPGLWLLLVPTRVEPGKLRADLTRLDPGIVLGFGPVATSLEEVAEAARRARSALHVGRRLAPASLVHDDSLLGVFAALDSDHGALERFVATVLGPLSTAPPARADEMLTTLQACVATSGVADAAKLLGVHRHTIVYRLQRLRDLGIDIDSPEQRHLIWLALRARQLLDTASD
jgi:biotin operon repressor